jgi:hypothetical protein
LVTTIVPSEVLAVFTTAVADPPLAVVEVVVFFDELESLEPPHAASAMTAAAPVATSP